MRYKLVTKLNRATVLWDRTEHRYTMTRYEKRFSPWLYERLFSEYDRWANDCTNEEERCRADFVKEQAEADLGMECTWTKTTL
jgi:hypothetical protein